MNPIVGILLAAGLSTRFGANNKCLHRLPNGRPIGLQAAKNLETAVDRVICIVPENTPDLNRVFIDNGLNTIVNTSPENGMAQSIRLAVHYAQQDQSYQGCLIALADMPWIKPRTIALIVDALGGRGGIVAPVYNGHRGHPVGFSKDYFHQLADLHGDSGARAIIQSAGEAFHLIEVDDAGVLQDIDTLDDLNRNLIED